MRPLLVLCVTLAAGPALAQAPAWSATASGAGFGLVLGTASAQTLSLACVRGTSEVLVIVPTVKPQAGQQELALSFDQQRFVFLLKPQAMKAGRAVEASAKAGPELLSAIRSAKLIEGRYAGARIGPYPAPPANLGAAFAQRCGPLI